MEMCRFCYASVIVVFFGLSGCAGVAWSPAPPQGRGWSYARQGALRSHSSSSSDTIGNLRITRHSRLVYRTDGPRGRLVVAPTPKRSAEGERLEPSELARRAVLATSANAGPEGGRR